MIRACPALLLGALVLLATAGCRTARPSSPSYRTDAQAYTPSFGEQLAQSRDHYVLHRSKELVRNGTFDSKDAAMDYARYEWSQQNNTARILSGEGFQTSGAPLRSPRAQKKAEKFRRDLADLDMSRP
jgi:hypothetical protein